MKKVEQKAPEPISKLLPVWMDKLGISAKSIAAAALVEQSLSELQPGAHVVALKKNRIFVEVESSVEAHELNFKRKAILKMFEPGFIDETVRRRTPDLKFVVKGTPETCLK